MIVVGKGLTVTTVVLIQPVTVSIYVIVAVPTAVPVTLPVDELTVTIGLALLQVPPPVASLNVVEVPTQILVTPVIVAGNGLIVTGVLIEQPVGKV